TTVLAVRPIIRTVQAEVVGVHKSTTPVGIRLVAIGIGVAVRVTGRQGCMVGEPNVTLRRGRKVTRRPSANARGASNQSGPAGETNGRTRAPRSLVGKKLQPSAI